MERLGVFLWVLRRDRCHMWCHPKRWGLDLKQFLTYYGSPNNGKYVGLDGDVRYAARQGNGTRLTLRYEYSGRSGKRNLLIISDCIFGLIGFAWPMS